MIPYCLRKEKHRRLFMKDMASWDDNNLTQNKIAGTGPSLRVIVNPFKLDICRVRIGVKLVFR